MAKVLKITKADKTVHIAPLSNKPALEAYNNRLKPDQKWKIEEVSEEEGKEAPYIDESHVTAGEALTKHKELSDQLSEKDKEIAELKALLAGQGPGVNNSNTETQLKASVKIEQILAATSVDQVNSIVGDDTRKTVLDAAAKKISEFGA